MENVFAKIVLLLFIVLLYVFEGLSLYTIAKRRGIRHYGFAWVPIGSSWVLGAIGDQYYTSNRGRKSYLRRFALVCTCVSAILNCVFLVENARVFASFLSSLSGYEYILSQESLLYAFGQATDVLTRLFVLRTLWRLINIALLVITYVGLYRIYSSSKPKYAKLFLVLSIIFCFTIPFFLFACRKSDAPLESAEDSINVQSSMHA